MIKTGTARNQLIDMIEYLPEAVVNQLLSIAQQYREDSVVNSNDPFYSEQNIEYLQSVISDIESGKETFVVKTIKELDTMANE